MAACVFTPPPSAPVDAELPEMSHRVSIGVQGYGIEPGLRHAQRSVRVSRARAPERWRCRVTYSRWAPAETLYPGANSRVMAAPPTLSCGLEHRHTCRPALAR